MSNWDAMTTNSKHSLNAGEIPTRRKSARRQHLICRTFSCIQGNSVPRASQARAQCLQFLVSLSKHSPRSWQGGWEIDTRLEPRSIFMSNWCSLCGNLSQYFICDRPNTYAALPRENKNMVAYRSSSWHVPKRFLRHGVMTIKWGGCYKLNASGEGVVPDDCEGS